MNFNSIKKCKNKKNFETGLASEFGNFTTTDYKMTHYKVDNTSICHTRLTPYQWQESKEVE